MRTGVPEGMNQSPTHGSAGAWTYVVARSFAEHSTLARISAGLEAVGIDREPEFPMFDGFCGEVLSHIHRLPPQQRDVLLADLAAGGKASTRMLMERLHTSCNSIYVSRANGRKALYRALLTHGHLSLIHISEPTRLLSISY